MPWRVSLVVRERLAEEGRVHVFEQEEVVIGRTPGRAVLVISHANISRRHCALAVAEDGVVRIRDLGSSNGIWVNGERAVDQVFGLADELMTGDHMVRLLEAPTWVEPRVVLVERELVRHPASSGTAVDRVVATLSVSGTDASLRYRIIGALARLRIPHGVLDPERLWEHTCAELFVLPSGGPHYREWNFSPTGQSARFSFSEYRQRTGFDADVVAVELARDRDGVGIVVRGVPAKAVRGARIGLTAITRDVDGGTSYWAAHHPSDRPDFHHDGGFVVSVADQPSAQQRNPVE